MNPEDICLEIHHLLENLPLFSEPTKVHFNNGLYFFYESGETSSHTNSDRIIRVGNHPRSKDRLIKRLKDHYCGNKNGSVFRRLLGGALLRCAKHDHPCLAPGPGLGHWEKQHERTCFRCKPIEGQVSDLLQSKFEFRCIEVTDRQERNQFEALLIATLAACSICQPTEQWIGRFAYSITIRGAGLWNNQNVNGRFMGLANVGDLSEPSLRLTD